MALQQVFFDLNALKKFRAGPLASLIVNIGTQEQNIITESLFRFIVL